MTFSQCPAVVKVVTNSKIKFSFLFLILILWSPSMLASQSSISFEAFEDDSLLAIEYFNIADSSYMNVEKCLKYSNLAIPLLKKTNQWEKYIYCLSGRSYCYKKLEHHDSIEYNNKLAFKEAEIHLSKSHELYISTMINLGYVYSKIHENLPLAEQTYKKALELTKKNKTNVNIRGSLLTSLGDVCLRNGDFKNAQSYFQEALNDYEIAFKLYVSEDNNTFYKIADLYQSIARVNQLQKKYTAATKNLNDMLRLMQKSNQPFSPIYYLYCYTHLSEIALQQKNPALAKKYLAKATKLKKLTPQQKAEIKKHYALLSLSEGNLASASTFINEAIQLAPTVQPVSISKLLKIKGDILFEKKQYKEALEILFKATNYLTPNDSISMEHQEINPNLKILSHLELISQFQSIAKCYEALFKKEGNPVHLKKTLNCFLIISSLSDQLRQDYQSEESKLFLNEKTTINYEKGINIAYQLYLADKDSDHLDKAFYLSEKSKAALLIEELKAKEAAGIYTIPSELVDKEYQIRIDINYYKKLIDLEINKQSKMDSIKLKNWNSNLFELTQQREQLHEKIEREYPDHAQLLRGPIPNLTSIQKELPNKHTAIVEYFLGEENSYAFFITKDTVDIKQLKNNQTLCSNVQKLLTVQRLNQSNSLGQFKKLSTQTFNDVIGFFNLDNIEKLVIIPDGCLSYLPFEILLTSPPSNNNIKEFDYLLKSRTISYSYSYALSSIKHKKDSSNDQLLVVAPIFKNNPNKYLQYSQEEIKPLSNLKSKILMDEKATVENFLRHAPESDLLYFSTHATSNDSVLNQPAIEFIDQQLYLSDLYTLNLSAQLAVLSACETGIGGQRKGEGVMSLARGFTYAGVHSVMTSLWKVNEKATSSIIESFFSYLEKGLNKDEALRQAKLDYIANAENIKATPYHWAGFVLIGDTAPYIVKETTLFWYLIIPFLIMLIGLLFYEK